MDSKDSAVPVRNATNADDQVISLETVKVVLPVDSEVVSQVEVVDSLLDLELPSTRTVLL